MFPHEKQDLFPDFVLLAFCSYRHFWNELQTSSTAVPIAIGINAFNCRLQNPYLDGSPIVCCDEINAQPKQLLVYDMLGRLQVSQTFSQETSIGQGLTPGSYFLVVKDENGGSFQRKIVIPR